MAGGPAGHTLMHWLHPTHRLRSMIGTVTGSAPIARGIAAGRSTPTSAPAIGHAPWHFMHSRFSAHARQRVRSTSAFTPRPSAADSDGVRVWSASVGHDGAQRLQLSVQCAGRCSSIGVQGPASEVNETLGTSDPVGQAA